MNQRYQHNRTGPIKGHHNHLNSKGLKGNSYLAVLIIHRSNSSSGPINICIIKPHHQGHHTILAHPNHPVNNHHTPQVEDFKLGDDGHTGRALLAASSSLCWYYYLSLIHI